MKFERLPLAAAHGHLLGHNVFRAGQRTLGKGARLGPSEIARLQSVGVDTVYVACVGPGDVLEDAAAERIAHELVAAAENTLVQSPAATGRVTLKATLRGVLRIEPACLFALNRVSGVTLAVRAAHSVIEAGEPLATLKIIPFALTEAQVREAEAIARQGVVRVQALRARRAVLIAFGEPDREAKMLAAFARPMRERLERLGSRELDTEYVGLDSDPEAALACALERHAARGCELAIVVGETATMDENDLAPAALRRAGGSVDALGAPVFPGNLLLIGRLGGCMVLGAPGCARHPALNVVDLVLPRMLSGERLARDEIAALGLGGLITPSHSGVEEGA